MQYGSGSHALSLPVREMHGTGDNTIGMRLTGTFIIVVVLPASIIISPITYVNRKEEMDVTDVPRSLNPLGIFA